MGGGATSNAGNRGVAATVRDASPLIALAQLDRLDLLHRLFSTILVPPAVVSETPRVVKPACMVVQPLTQPVPQIVLEAGLGRGETEAIALALEVTGREIILDDRGARRLAQRSGVQVIGTVGVLLLAKSTGLISSMRPEIEAPRESGFHLNTRLVENALALANE